MIKKTVTYYKNNPEILSQKEDECGAILYDPSSNSIKEINHTGLFIYNLCQFPHTKPQIISEIEKKYASIDQNEVSADIDLFLNDLLNTGFLHSLIDKNE